MNPTWQRVARLAKLIAFVSVLALALLFGVLYVRELGVNDQLSGRVNDLTTTARRQRPTADYTSAEFAHTDCRKNIEDRFFGAIGRALNDQLDPAARNDARVQVAIEGDKLDNIEHWCPTPTPPTFDDDGNLIAPPVIPTPPPQDR